ncbi:MAG: hypothetical protein KKF26_06180, partial [Chloroflexi bacterium]|nr:hypothetical protein [Chloroflexota bacterium]
PTIYTAPVVVTIAVLLALAGVSYYYTIKAVRAHNNKWLYYLAPAIIAGVAILLLPMFKGYYLPGRNDMAEHTGHVIDIIRLGYATSHNHYPLQHIIPALFAGVSHVPANVAAMMVMPMSYMVYLLGMGLLLTQIFKNKLAIAIGLILSSLLIEPMSGTWQATNVAAMVMPLALGAALRAIRIGSIVWWSFAVIMAVAVALLHYTAIIIYVGAILAASIIYRNKVVASLTAVTLAVGLLFIMDRPILSELMSYLPGLHVPVYTGATDAITTFTRNLIGEAGLTWAMDTGATSSALFILLLKKMAVEGIIITCGMAFALKFLLHRHVSKAYRWAAVVYMGLVATYTMSFWGIGINEVMANGRFLPYLATFSVLLVVPGLCYSVFHKLIDRRVIVVILVLLAFMAAMKVYPSPYTGNPNEQVTYTEIQNMRDSMADDNAVILNANTESVRRIMVAANGVQGWYDYYVKKLQN